ncbi:glycosyl hydrolase family 18 protein [Flavivirga sp. 57AJ16]|uniref:glycosyl hydrolase family 18 protein n=1 Tax=Flavivirga sp. 57AJ16 TaxID=3025307 RepID=UPI002366C1ED|nr:glycosyl hydrolase family 18 protein [Flavivirga sp. 57AJ16]MDD7886346.1 glycosyl hydrolase family 18 protein [Flavivirga sp. 57AJ16]
MKPIMHRYFYRNALFTKTTLKIFSCFITLLLLLQHHRTNAQVNTGGNSSTSNHTKQIIGYITNWDAWKQPTAGVPAQGALTQLNIDYSKYTILNYSFFGVANDGSLHSGDLRNKQIYQSGSVQQPGDILFSDVYSSWDYHILFGEIEPIQYISEAVKLRAEALGYQVTVGGNTWSHPEWGLQGTLPLPLPKVGSGGKGLLELAHQNGVKVMASIGGWSMCKHFPEMAADATKRARFIEDCKKLISMGFDGIDLDWEYPGPFSGMNFTGTNADYANFENLVQEIRNAIGPDKLITAAMAADYKKLEGFNWSKLANTMDYFNMMTYDFNGGWSNKAGHNAPVYPYDGAEAPDFNWQTLLNKMISMGIPSNKINFGIPFYGRGVVTNGNAALNAPTVKRNVTIQPDGPVSTAADYTNWPQEVYDGTPNHFFIKQKTGAGSGWTRQWDDQAKVPYMTKGNFFLSYDDEESIGIKAQYIKDNNLAGTIVWTVYGDLEMSGSVQSFGTKLKRWSNVKSPLINKVNEVFASGGVDNILPSVSMTSPNSGATFAEGSNITIAANASDSDGTVTKVAFYNGDTKIGEATSAPYTYNWNNVSAGNYTIKAKATDDKGGTATSTVSITVTGSGGNQLPIISITSPQAGDTFTSGANISISSTASDSDGTIAKVAFYNGTILLGEKTSAPYTYSWNNVSEGNYTITVKAFDDKNGESSSSVSITVNNTGGSCTAPAYVHGTVYTGGDIVSYQGNEYKANWWTQNNDPVTNRESVWELIGPCNGNGTTAPQVAITSPTSGTNIIVGNSITINVNASDSNGSVSKVEFYNGTTKLGEDLTSPYSYTWNNAAIGSYTLTAKATDNDNEQSTSSAISISVSNDGGCTGNSNFKVVGYMPSWQGSASNIQYDKLTHINYSFLIPNSNGSLQTMEGVAKMQQIITQGHTQGVKVLIAVGGWLNGNDSAFTTLAANPATRTTFINNLVNFVNQYNLDGVDMDWEYPREGSEPQNYELLMQELGEAMHSRGKLLTAAVVVSGWNADGILAGVFDDIDFLNIMAYDGPDHSTMAQAEGGLNYWLNRGLPKSKAVLGVPFYSRSQVKSYAELLAMGASANSDSYQGMNYNGIPTIKAKTELALEKGGGIMMWELSNDTNDQATSLLTAINQVAGDPCGENNMPPTVVITSPASGASFTTGSSVTINANASDSDGSLTKVAFYLDNTMVSEDTSSPYTANWTATTGNHTLTAKATDNEGAVTTSSSIAITVTGETGNELPTVSITNPSAGSTYTVGQSVSIAANASDNDGSISKVSFYLGNTMISEDTSPPYTANWTAILGNHSITAIATDNDAATSTSTAVNITVNTESNCDAAQYVDGSAYNTGDVVQNFDKKYECIVGGWCTIGGPYAPGDPDGWAWPNAWKEIGDCTGGDGTFTVSITQPTIGANFTVGESVNIAANANDTAGSVTKVVFYVDGSIIGEDFSAPYNANWIATSGSHTLTAQATNNTNTTADATPVTITVGSINPPGGDLPKRILVGYWHNFINEAGPMKLSEISDKWDVINIAFAVPTTPIGSTMTFTPDPAIYPSVQAFKNDVAVLQSKGKKVLISMGGETGVVGVNTAADAQAFSSSMINIINEYGFDGMDIDFEGQSISLVAGDTDFKNPTSPKVVNLISAFRTIISQFNSDFILSMAPETLFVQGGFSSYGGVTGAYLPIIHALRDNMNYIHVQHYNTGCMLGLDGLCYSSANADFHVAMADLLLQGFPVAGGQQFPALRPDQVAIGLPATSSASGSGYTAPAEVHKALDYIIKGQSFGGRYTLRNPSGYSNFRGLMTWSINWDKAGGFGFSNPHRTYLDALSGLNADLRLSPVSNLTINNVDVRPNPVIGGTMNMTVKASKANTDFNLQIFNTSGIKMLETKSTLKQQGNNLKSFDVSRLQEGLYFYIISLPNEQVHGKVMIKH